MKKRLSLLLACVAILFFIPYVPSYGNEAVFDLVGKDAPLFVAEDPDGKPLLLDSLLKEKGPVLLNFWGLRCASCIEEIPHLNDLHRKYGPSGLKIVGVNVDGLPGPKIKAQMERMTLEILYPWIPDPDFKVIDLYHMQGAPLNVIINSLGKVIYYHEGFEEGDEAKIEAGINKAMLRARDAK